MEHAERAHALGLIIAAAVLAASAAAWPMPGQQVAHATAPAQADLTAAPPAGETAPYRILAKGDLDGMGQGEVLSERDGAALIGYSGKDERDAAVLAMGSADFAVPDTAFSAATGASAPFADALIDDAHALAAPAAPASAYDVAIIDTAVSGEVAASISVLGEGSTHATGHGDATLEAIKSEFPAARILAIEALDGSGTGSSASVYAAMMAAIEAGPKVIALPLSARALAGNAAVEEAVLQAHAAGIIVVGAAGNDAADARWFVPGGIADIVVAGACDTEGNVLVSSNRGATVDAYVPSPSTSHAAAVMAGYLAFRSSFESLEADIADAIARGKFFAYAPPEPIGIERMGDGLFRAAGSSWGYIQSGTYYIRCRASSAYTWTIASATAGTRIYSKAYSASNRLQQFYIKNTGQGYCELWPASASGLRVDVNGGSSASGAAIQVYTSNGTQAQRWYIDQNNNGSGTFYAVGTGGMAADVSGANYNGGALQLYPGSDEGGYGSTNAAQQFTLERAYYNVKFNGNGSTSGTSSTQKIWIDEATALTANPFARKHTVTYNYNGSGAANTTVTATSTFSGWATSASGAKSYNNKASVTNLTTTHGATVNLYAAWTLGKVTLPTPTRTGYTFAGWYTAASGGTKVGAGGAAYSPTANTTLYAHWTANTMTLKFHANGGSITTGTGATRWRKGSDSLVERSTDSGATWADITNSLSIESGAYPNLWNVGSFGLARTGYHITGTRAWNTKADGTGISVNQDYSETSTANPATAYRINGNANLTANKTVTLYANWEANAYSVRYNGNGATAGAMADSAHTYDVAKALSANAFSRSYTVAFDPNGGEGLPAAATATFAFAGWNTAAAGTGTAYADKAQVTNLTTANSGTVNLYAQWRGGTVALPAPVRDGFTFDGWYLEPECTNLAGRAGDAYTPSANTTLYAKWTKLPNLEFTVPAQVTCIADAHGTLSAAEPEAFYLENLSSFAIRVDGLDIDVADGWECVPTDAGAPDGQAIALRIGPPGHALEASACLDGAQITDADAWTMQAHGAAEAASKLPIGISGWIAGMRDIAAEGACLAQIHWHVRAAE